MATGDGEILGVMAIMQDGTTLGLIHSTILGTMAMQATMVGTPLGIMDGVVIIALGIGAVQSILM